MPTVLRRSLSEHWVKVGLMEHASIAAFARFALQLLSLGAPPELIEAAGQAVKDETEHARLAFELASSYAERPLDPGKLALDDAFGEMDLTCIALNTVLEGCIGETIAAMEAEWASQESREPALCRVLDTIARDEHQHADLAWRFIRWALEQRPELSEPIMSLLKDELAQAERAAHSTEPEVDLLAFGVVNEKQRAVLRAEALRNVILPCMKALQERHSVRAQLPRASVELTPSAATRSLARFSA
jgi:hypothetical protein